MYFFFLLGQTRCLWWSLSLKALFSLFLPTEPVKYIRNLKFEIWNFERDGNSIKQHEGFLQAKEEQE
jgi:hypothetical protein